jgi:hypothetical protein
MGNSTSNEKSVIEQLCTSIILAKSESQFTSVESNILDSLTKLRDQLLNVNQRNSILSELKEGRKGIPSLIYCMMWKSSGNEDNKISMKAYETLFTLLTVDSSICKVLFEQELLGPINKICMTAKRDFKQIGVKILNFLTLKSEYYNDLNSFNPLYTLNSLLLASSNSVNEETRILALMGIKNLADKYKQEFVINGIIATLLNILHENSRIDEVTIVMSTLAKSADEPNVAKYLLDEHFPAIIDKYLSHNSLDVRGSAAMCIQALCKLEKGREIIQLSSLKLLHNLANEPEGDSRLAAKSALMSLCLNEAKLNYFTKKKWVDEILNTFKELQNDDNKKRVVILIHQLSTECLKYTLYQLFKSLPPPLFVLIQDQNPEIQGLALKSLVNLSVRLDLQAEYYGFAEMLIKNFEKFHHLIDRSSTLTILSILSVKNTELINQTFYTNFFFTMADKSYYSNISEITEENEKTGKTENIQELIENMLKLARLTCISFPSNEVQSIINEKLKFVNSQCRSQNTKIRYRAVGTLAVLALKESLRSVLYTNEFFDTIMLMLSDYEDEIKLVACYALNNILRSPERLLIWFKFDSSFVIDASNNHTLAVAVKKNPLLRGSGLYLNWGKEFLKSEIIIIPTFPQVKEWTVCTWFRIPLPEGDKILVQGKSGTGAVIAANDDYFYSIDKKTGAEVPLWSSLKSLKKGWHHLAVTYTIDKKILARVNNESTRVAKEMNLEETFKYFANNKKGKNPFGTICDFRIYDRCLTVSEIEVFSKYNENIVFGLPDKYCEYANIADIPTALIQLVQKDRDVAKISALQVLSCLATKSSCRASMLRNSVIPLIVSNIRNVNMQISEFSARCLVNLG